MNRLINIANYYLYLKSLNYRPNYVLTAILHFVEKKMMFARLDFSRFLTCCSEDLADNESEEKHYFAMCGGWSICILTGIV